MSGNAIPATVTTDRGVSNVTPQEVQEVSSSGCCAPLLTWRQKATNVGRDFADQVYRAETVVVRMAEVTQENLANFEAACARYGANIAAALNAAQQGINTASKEGVILLTGMNKDLDKLILLLQAVAKKVPDTASRLEPIIYSLKGHQGVIENLIVGFNKVDDMIDDATVVKPVEATKTVATTLKNAGDLVREFQLALDAAVAIGALPSATSTAIQRALNDGMAITNRALGASNTAIEVDIAPKPNERAFTAPSIRLT